jgi:hypothetical protein
MGYGEGSEEWEVVREREGENKRGRVTLRQAQAQTLSRDLLGEIVGIVKLRVW